MIHGRELKLVLMHHKDIEDPENNDDIVNEVNKNCDELIDRIPRFEMKHNTEFSPWLTINKITSKTRFTERKEIVAAEEVVQRLVTNFHNKTKIADNIQTSNEISQEDITRASRSGFLTTDFGLEEAELSVTMSNVTMSRAPAAS